MRDYCATGVLAVLLVITAVTVSGLTSAVQLIYVQPDLCETRDSSLVANMELMRNITNYYNARATASLAVNITATAYFKAAETYTGEGLNALGLAFEWPSAYDLNEEQRQELETEAREGGDDCEPVEECVGGVAGFFGDIVGETTCVETEVPCPDIESTELLVEYDASQQALDLFGNNITAYDEEYAETLAQSALDDATSAISVLVRRINFASSIYVLYLVFTVLVPPPFTVYGAKWNVRIFEVLSNVNKPMWIALIVLVWYGHELFQSIINSSLYNIIWSNFLQDPCWADPEFLVNTSMVISETCTEIISASNLFNQAGANYRYYGAVEATWQPISEGRTDGPIYGDADVDFPQEFPGNCTSSVLLSAIQPGDGNVNWWSLFFRSGALVALLLQITLAHWFISWFSVLRPLTMHKGRVMIPNPETNQSDPVLFREVRAFARRRATLPFVFMTLLLLFLLINLGVSSSAEGMGRKVLIGSAILFALQFVVVPLLVWRPSDERWLPAAAMPPDNDGSLREDYTDDGESDSYDDKEEGGWDSENDKEPGSSLPRCEQNHHSFRDDDHPRYRDDDAPPRSRTPQRQEQKLERSDSGDSLSSILAAARAATSAAAAVGEGRQPPRY
ncbi:unnamed protein product [Ectocarpus sp. 6 AP-2014]